MVAEGNKTRVILAGQPVPASAVQVRDDQGRTWERGEDGRFHTPDNRHHQTDRELSARSDLVVLAGDPIELGLAA